jgi:glycosyltransferase involved in cell wall biosynthesis
MKILIIINGLGYSKKAPIGGSDKRAVELARQLTSIKGCEVTILTTSPGKHMFLENEGLRSVDYIVTDASKFADSVRVRETMLGRLWAYIELTFASAKHIFPATYDVVYASSDFFCDLLPAVQIGKSRGSLLVCFVHHRIPSPFGREGSFLKNCGVYALQNFSFWVIKRFFNLCLVYDTPEGATIEHNLKNLVSVARVFNGIAAKTIDDTDSKDCEDNLFFDACYVGGVRPSKGIPDLINFWRIVAEGSTRRLGIIGGGLEQQVAVVEELIRDAKMEDNIVFLGPRSQRETFAIMKQSKYFISLSYEEGWGMAVYEALYAGKYCFVYNLPAYQRIQPFLVSVDVGFYKDLVPSFINHEADGQVDNVEGHEFVRKYSWESVAMAEYNLFCINKAALK